MFRLRICLFCLLGGLSLVTQAAVILQYHHVSDDTPASTSISPALFKEHLAYLTEQEFKVWPLPKLVKHLQAGASIPDKVVVISFDDAYDSIYKTAWPLLRERNMPFTVFVAPEPIEQKLASFMSWQQLAEMKTNGATIANHSYSHAHLVRRLSDETQTQWLARISGDIEKAQNVLIQRLGDTPKLLAYPYGEYSQALAERIGSLGYVAFGQQSGAVSSQHDLAALPRFPMTNHFGEMSQFNVKVASLPLPAKTVSPDTRVMSVDSAPKTLRISLYPQALNEQQVSCYFSGKGRVAAKVSRSVDSIDISIDALPEMPPGRSRLNCTAPSTLKEMAGRFHWFSYFWMRKNQDGSWYEED